MVRRKNIVVFPLLTEVLAGAIQSIDLHHLGATRIAYSEENKIKFNEDSNVVILLI